MTDFVTGENVEAAAPHEHEPTQSEESQMVPLSALQEERRKRQAFEDDIKLLKDHMALLSMRSQQPEKPVDDGLADDDILTIGQAKQMLSQVQRNQGVQLKEMKMQQKYTDYQEVITKYLPPVLKDNPSLVSSIEAADDPFELGYYIAKNSKYYRNEHKEQSVSKEAERIMENAARAGSLSSVGSSAPKSSVRRDYSAMPEAEFRQLFHKNLGYA